MEPSLETADAQMIRAIEKSKPLIQQPLIITLLTMALIAIAGVTILFQQNIRLEKQNQTQQKELSVAHSEISELSNKIESYKADSNKIAEIVDNLQNMGKLSYLSYIQHEIEGGVVTDDFVVAKIDLTPNADSDKLITNIDLITQPAMEVHYLGKGSFNLPDRELRAKSQAIIEAVKQHYESSTVDSKPAWDDSNVRLTIKNYEIGDTTSGEFKLVGEK